jgi:hypothetical protein
MRVRIQPRVLLLCLLLLLQGARADDKEPLEKLLARAAVADDHQAELCAKVVQREVQESDQYFARNEMEKGYAAVKAADAYTTQTLEAALRSRKRLKQAEIILRETSRRLLQLSERLTVADRAPLKPVVQHMDEVRSNILTLMFAPEKPKSR